MTTREPQTHFSSRSLTSVAAWAVLVLAGIALAAWKFGADEGQGLAFEGEAQVSEPAQEQPALENVILVETSSDQEAAVEREAQVIETEKQDFDFQGLVIDPFGKPLGDAQVLFWRSGPNGPEESPLEGRSDSKGCVELNLPDWAKGAELIVVARKRPYRPATGFWSLARSGEEVLELQLEVGETMQGVLTRAGQGQAEVQLYLDLKWLTPGAPGQEGELYWMEGRMEEKWLEPRTDALGRFSVSGLGPYEYRVAWTSHGICLPRGQERQVLASPAEVQLIEEFALLELQVNGISGPVRGARLTASVEGNSRTETTTGTPLLLNVPARTDILLELTHDDFRRVERTVLSPGVGQREVVLLDLFSIVRPSLRIRTDRAMELGVDELFVQAHAPDRETLRRKVRRDHSSNEFVIDPLALDPGPWTFRVGSPENQGYVDVVQGKFEVPDSGWLVIDVALEQGARAQVELKSALNEWSANYSLEHATGQVVLSRSVQRFEMEGMEDGVFETMGMPSFGGSLDPGWHDKIYPAGGYWLLVESPQHQTLRKSVTLTPGQTERIVVELQPK